MDDQARSLQDDRQTIERMKYEAHGGSGDHRQSVARSVATMRAVREQLEDDWQCGRRRDAEQVSRVYLETLDAPAPDVPDQIDVDAPSVINVVVSLDRFQAGVIVADRSALADAGDSRRGSGGDE